MIDELLGRAELKDRIEALREERDSFEAQLEAEQERRAEAASERQAAERRVNRLEDRVTELEDRVERAESAADDDRSESFARVHLLDEGERGVVLDRLRSVESAPETLLTAMVEEPGDEVREAFGSLAPLVARAAPCLALTDDHGLLRAVLDPPFPPDPFVEWGDRFRLEPSWFEPPARHAVALVRADLFALGIYADGERVEFRSFTADIEENHSKGGFSQARYGRRRDEQIAGHLDDAREALAGLDVPLVLTGGRESLDALSPDVSVRSRTTVDASGTPEDALAAARRDALSTGLYAL